MLDLDIAVTADGWSAIDPAALADRCAQAITQIRPDLYQPGLVALLFTDDDEVRALNRDWRQKDKTTNVLSFPAEPMPPLAGMAMPLGDIALAAGVCHAEAAEKAIGMDQHTTHLIVHGILHLFGYDHLQDEEARVMESLERQILSQLGVADPYAP